jgi:photosystem II stability/assembly factor-like uncharacterized protein
MNCNRRITRTLFAAIGFAMAPLAPAAGFVDVLDTPAQMSPLAARSLMQAVTRVDGRLVAVGQRGHILLSTDAGASWKQARVPVSSDLTAVYFADMQHGWSVGHDGVVLSTQDGGDSWRVQLDGRKANELLVEAMRRAVAADPTSESAKKLLAEAQRYQEQGPDKPFLDVWFADARNGFVVGAYNLIFRTRDGGNTWESWFDRTDNPKFFNLYAIRRIGSDVYAAGESGLLLKLDSATDRLKAIDTGYTGSFFGLAEAKGAVLAYGLRGSVFRSDDAGKTWSKVDAGLPASIVASTRTMRDATLLADAGGRMVASDDAGRSFHAVALKQPMPLTGFTEVAEGRFAITGPRGIALTAASH